MQPGAGGGAVGEGMVKRGRNMIPQRGRNDAAIAARRAEADAAKQQFGGGMQAMPMPAQFNPGQWHEGAGQVFRGQYGPAIGSAGPSLYGGPGRPFWRGGFGGGMKFRPPQTMGDRAQSYNDAAMGGAPGRMRLLPYGMTGWSQAQ